MDKAATIKKVVRLVEQAAAEEVNLLVFPETFVPGYPGEHVHAGAWPALSTMKEFESVADAQIEALMKAHALTAQVWVVTASNYVDGGVSGVDESQFWGAGVG
ncbi:hypothetical protein N657DRAFT_650827 [Parathielavia appendiculata]|uniref:CN hydrolase domain-containing protein n=1 Tax=Parathielavia appendiculata TaxID=2587402 RepID=A0AAN6YZ24_9PEZI|nr:hypothetical protein N657DRAFT_650827 [Parathielavia appendiculata]